MTRFLTVVALMAAMMLTSCKKEQSEKSCCSQEKPVVEQESCCSSKENVAEVLTPEDILAKGVELVDQEIQIKGTVTHICKHGGKKCSIMGATPEAFVQVMAGEEIGSFPTDVMGSNILVKGIVKENRMTKEAIAEREAAMQAQAAENSEAHEGGHHCSHSSASKFDAMKKWMEENGKDYYPIYFIQGISYEVAE